MKTKSQEGRDILMKKTPFYDYLVQVGASDEALKTAANLLATIKTLREDMRMLKAGQWVPDEASVQASIDVADAVIREAEGC